jgi:putative ABC transport system permease protein
VSGWRPALRIARRDALRHKGRSTLVAVLVALPVLAASFVDVVGRSEQLDPQDVVAVQLLPTQQAQIHLFSQGMRVEQDPVDSNRTAGSGSEQAVSITLTDLDAQVQALVPQGDRALVTRTWNDSPRITVGDHSLRVTMRETTFAPGAQWLSLAEGSMPSQPDQVVVSGDLADHEGLRVGATLGVPSPSGAPRSYRVSGVARAAVLPNPMDARGRLQAVVVGLPGAILPATVTQGSVQVGWSLVGPVALTWTDILKLNAVGYTALSRQVVLNPPDPASLPQATMFEGSNTNSTVVGVVSVAILLVLLQIALLAGPALAVGARRNTRTLALVAAAGGCGRHLRLIVLAGGLVVGTAGSLVAAALGAGIAAGLTPWLRASEVMHGPRVDLHLLDLFGLAVVGAVTAVAAAWMPARQAARLDVVATLTGRRGQAAPRLRVPLLGLVLTAVGIGVGVVAARTYYPVWLAVAIAVAEIGLIVATGSLISLAARLARRTALPLRMALRDAARQRGRTVPAVAAVMAAVAGLVSAGIFLATQEAYNRNRYQPHFAANDLLVRSPADFSGPATTTGLPTPTSPGDVAAVRSQVRAALQVQQDVTLVGLATRSGLTVDAAADRQCPPLPGAPPSAQPTVLSDEQQRSLELRILEQSKNDDRCRSSVPLPSDVVSYSPSNGPLVDDTGRAVALLTGTQDPQVSAALTAGRVVVWERNLVDSAGLVHLHLDDPAKNVSGPVVALPATVVHSRPGLLTPVLPTSAARRLGAPIAAAGYLAQLSKPPTADTVAALQATLARTGDWMPEANPAMDSGLGATLLALVAAAMLVALVGTLTAVGLAQVEGRADSATLSAVGASPGVRRRLAAMQALTIAGLGTLLGLAAGLGAGWGMVQLRLTPATVGLPGGVMVGLPGNLWSLVVPWPQLALGTVGLVLIAMTVAFVTTRSTLPLQRRLTT